MWYILRGDVISEGSLMFTMLALGAKDGSLTLLFLMRGCWVRFCS